MMIFENEYIDPMGTNDFPEVEKKKYSVPILVHESMQLESHVKFKLDWLTASNASGKGKGKRQLRFQ